MPKTLMIEMGDYVDSAAFSFERQLAFTEAVLVATDEAASLPSMAHHDRQTT